MTATLEDYKPRDPGTAIASSIGICFISVIFYGGLFQLKDEFHQLRHANWSEVRITPAEGITWHITEFRTGDVSIYLDQYQNQLYEQRCNSFKSFCLSVKDNTFHPTAFYFYSNTPTISSTSQLYLKEIEFSDAQNQVQALTIMDTTPNNPKYIEARKQDLKSNLLWEFFSFSMFSLVFYFNHLGRYSENISLIKKMNLAIVLYYVGSILFFIIQYFQL